MKSKRTSKTIGTVWRIFFVLSLVMIATFALPPANVRAQGAYPGYIINFTPDDLDGDGVPNEQDNCENSNILPTVIIKGCDAGVTNVVFPDGCTMSDLLGECYANSTNNGQFVSCGEHYINDWYNIGLITNAERRDIKTCMMNAYLPTDQAFIAGTVFNDANGNGKQDDNESGIADVTVTLDGSATSVTNQQGAYVFQINQGGAHTVVETDPPGFISTTPNKVTVNVIMGQYYLVNFGDTNQLTDKATIYGTVFNDANGNGAFDDGETGIPWAEVSLDGIMRIANGLGQYTFQVTTAGVHTIEETDPPGYRSTTPNKVSIEVTLGNSYLVNFGDTDNLTDRANIYGTVFNDDNGNGLQDNGETGIPGVSVALDDNTVYVTNYLGQYTFQIAEAGSHKVTETDLDGFISTTPNEVTVNVVLGNSYLVDFGDSNKLRTTISGMVFNDANVNGIMDQGEAGIKGVKITLSGNNSSIETITDDAGAYQFAIAMAGTYTIAETDLTGFISTNAIPGSPAVIKIDINSLRAEITLADIISQKQLINNLFGDAALTSVIEISGQVWEDGNANGQPDAGEPGLAGATIKLSSGLEQTTAADGNFMIYGPINTPITVNRTNPAGYSSTNAIPGDAAQKVNNDTISIDGVLAPKNPEFGNTYSANNLFGAVQTNSVAIISGTVFSDENENGVLDNGEAGVPDVLITLEDITGSMISVRSNSGGFYQFVVATGKTVSISSQGPGGGFYPTTPERIVITLQQSIEYQNNNFGYSNDASVAVIYGTVFDDADADGVQDINETGIAGVTVTRDNSTPQVTNQLGQYTFPMTEAGFHTVVETDPAGYYSTTPNQVNVNVSLGSSYRVDFGDTSNLTDRALIYGTVFNDANGNGVQDAGEAGIASVNVTLDDSAGYVTNAWGQYVFPVTVAGVHRVVETDPAGYRSTTPNEVNVEVSLGNIYQVNFGDTDNLTDRANIYGTVFNDANRNGVQDASEIGIAGVTVTLENAFIYTTNTFGQYTFQISEAGMRTVVETDPSGFISTTPNDVSTDVILGNSYVVNFGDAIEIITTTTTVVPTTTTTVISTTTTTIIVPPPDCTVDADCDDGNFCNGAETCVEGVCQSSQNPCDPEQQICSESLNTCVDIKKIEASTAFLPRRDVRKLRAPILFSWRYYWLRVKIKAENNVDLEKSVFNVEGPTQGASGVLIDNTIFRKIRGALLRKNRENVFWVPISVAKNAARGTWKITITTDRTDVADPFIEIVEGRFIIREKLFQR
jgi:hypothetical protein